MPDIHLVNRIKKAFREREIINSIQKIGLACPIVSYKAIQPRYKIQDYLRKILEIYCCQIFKIHARKGRYWNHKSTEKKCSIKTPMTVPRLSAINKNHKKRLIIQGIGIAWKPRISEM
jgi:hypothetical protein